MNVFEDLIGSLKDENLLEATVIETQEVINDDEFLFEVIENQSLPKDSGEPKFAEQTPQESENNFSRPQQSPVREETEEIISFDDYSSLKAEDDVLPAPAPVFKENKSNVDEKEFYRKRAIEEVSGLQMVEHVLSGVEREQNKTAPKLYNDIAVKKALHDFLQISQDVKSPEHAQYEFQLMQETETWCSALSHRDKRIPVAHLRRYCETTKPPLSSQALISLARFYRNLPFSEQVRSKFDLIVTRLFSKDLGGEKRILVFTRDELIKHLAELYGEWSSIPLYSTEEDESQIVLTAMKFEDFMTEAESAESFDELIKTDFFNRLRLFKESTNEVFFAPLITATTIESNIRIGNKYVDLIEIERSKSNAQSLQDKYGFLHDQAISDSTSKTLELIELLKDKVKESKVEKVQPPADKTAERQYREISKVTAKKLKPETKPKPETKLKSEKFVKQSQDGFFAANKRLIIAAVVIAVISFGLYLGVNFMGAGSNAPANAKKVNLENSSLKAYVQSARISEETFYGVTTPAWDDLATQKKEELLKKIYASGGDKGFKKVQLLNKEGKDVGFASAEKTEVLKP
jgi:hypothetical protein